MLFRVQLNPFKCTSNVSAIFPKYYSMEFNAAFSFTDLTFMS